MSPSAFYPSLLHTAVLVNFACTARLYDILRREPTFFTVRRAGPWDIVALVAVLSLVLPGVFLLLEIVARRIGQRTWAVTHRVCVVLLMALIALAALRSLDLLPWPLLLAGGLILGWLAATLYARFGLVQRIVTVLWPAILVFPAWMLLASPARMAFSDGFDPPAIEVPVARPAPVVLIVFDEFCGMSLAAADGKIDARRFPNFAALAAEATWFRNATTMSPSTHEALPCILTGRFPKDPSHPPEVYEYPENIFRLLGRSHRPVVFETETRLCPPHLRNWPAAERGFLRQLGGMCLDLAVVDLHLLLPPEGPFHLPSLDGRWSNFLDQDEDAGTGHAGFSRRAEQFEEFIARIRPGPSRSDSPPLPPGEGRGEGNAATGKSAEEKKPSPPAPLPEGEGRLPGFYFAHVMLPHVPYDYFPSGKSYEFPLSVSQQQSHYMTHGVIGLKRHREQWVEDRTAVSQAAQRYLLQVEFVDRLIGRLVRRLKEVGLYDDTLIVLTADHGVSFRPGDLRREVTKDNHADILSIPLLIKAPRQRQGSTSDRNVQSADIVPTIAGLLGVAVPWRLDGVSALDRATAPPGEKGLTPEETWARRQTFDAALPEKFETWRHLETLVGRRGDAYDLFATGPDADMAGRAVEDFALGEVPEVQVEVAGNVRSCCLVGRLAGPGLPSGPLEVAVAVNGRIAAVTRVLSFADFTNTWTALLPPESIGDGENDVAVYLVSGAREQRVLLPLKRAK